MPLKLKFDANTVELIHTSRRGMEQAISINLQAPMFCPIQRGRDEISLAGQAIFRPMGNFVEVTVFTSNSPFVQSPYDRVQAFISEDQFAAILSRAIKLFN